MIYVIAREEREAYHWAHQHNVPKGCYIYIDRAERLAGLENPDVVFVGTWWARNDAEELETRVAAQRRVRKT